MNSKGEGKKAKGRREKREHGETKKNRNIE